MRGLKGGVKKLLDELREKSQRLDESPVLQRIREVGFSKTSSACMMHHTIHMFSKMYL